MGASVKAMRHEDELAQISLVMQDVQLFNMSIYVNIAVGRVRASREGVMAAEEAARAYEFILALPEGYNTRVWKCVGASGSQDDVGVVLDNLI